MARLEGLPPLSLYVHIPWCLRKCPYCDFNSHEKRGDVPEDAYVDALVADLEAALPDVWGRKLSTIFIGGGTPSLFMPASIERLLTAVRTLIPLEPWAEVTMEANPGTFEIERFRGFHAAGVTRLSIGVQSFDDAKLAALGRVHGSNEARAAIEAAQSIFPAVNIDLMYALPGQRLEEAVADVRAGIAFGVGHVSAYHLTLEPDTNFARFPPELPDDDASADMQEAIEGELAAAGFEHYETSAFAKPGRRARHNLNYWSFGDYLGIGAGAHGKLSFRDRIVREVRERKPQTYMAAAMETRAVFEQRVVGDDELPFEFMLNALRLVEGFPLALFTQRTGLQLASIEPQIARAVSAGLLERTLTHARPTAKGQRFLNDLLETFLPDARGRGARRVISICSAGTPRPS
jgi:putative oxygen-independent coproporphyrinogen III oxidase